MTKTQLQTHFIFLIFDFLILKTFQKQQKQLFIQQAQKQQDSAIKTISTRSRWGERWRRNMANYKNLQARSVITNTKIYTRTYQKSRGSLHINNSRITYLWPFDLELPTFNLLFSSVISSKYSKGFMSCGREWWRSEMKLCQKYAKTL